jgi:hypothetical protein
VLLAGCLLSTLAGTMMTLLAQSFEAWTGLLQVIIWQHNCPAG